MNISIKNQDNFNIDYVTDIVELPSRGLVYKDGLNKVKIRALVAKDDDILYSPELIKSGKVFDALLDAIILDKIDTNNLITGDRNTILIHTRILSIGETYQPMDIECPNCNNKIPFVYDLSKLNIKQLEIIPDENLEFPLTLPTSKANIKFRFLNNYDEITIEKNLNVHQKIQKNYKITNMLSERYKFHIMEINGTRDKTFISNFVDKMPFKDAIFFKNYLKNVSPGIDFNYTHECPHCSHTWNDDMPLTPKLFYINEI